VQYLKLQINAGVDAIQIFDSWAHILGHNQFCEFSLKYLEKLVQAVQGFPTIIFCRGSSVFAPMLMQIAPACISLDWQERIGHMRRRITPNIALQGNLDPDVLYAEPAIIRKEAHCILKDMQGDPGFIFNLGHGIHPDTPVEAVKTLVDCVKSL
jgi:uroporphyrinogen decarboxylase